MLGPIIHPVIHRRKSRLALRVPAVGFEDFVAARRVDRVHAQGCLIRMTYSRYGQPFRGLSKRLVFHGFIKEPQDFIEASFL